MNDEQKGEYLRQMAADLPSKTSVRDLVWTRPEAGTWAGSLQGASGILYQAIVRYRVFEEAWEAMCMVNGTLVHRSEHESRGDAACEVIMAILRAIDIRERTAP